MRVSYVSGEDGARDYSVQTELIPKHLLPATSRSARSVRVRRPAGRRSIVYRKKINFSLDNFGELLEKTSLHETRMHSSRPLWTAREFSRPAGLRNRNDR